MLLLTSSLTSVYAMYHMKNYNWNGVRTWMGITVLLGLGFLGLEIYEFNHYVHIGFGYNKSAFSSAFFTLVGYARFTRNHRASLDYRLNCS